MALARFTRSYLSMGWCKTPCDVSKLCFQTPQRSFSSSQLKRDMSGMDKNVIRVDRLSKFALVLEGKYKTLKDVPPFLSHSTVYKARDKFRIKASIVSGIFLIMLLTYLIKKNKNERRFQEYEMMQEAPQKN